MEIKIKFHDQIFCRQLKDLIFLQKYLLKFIPTYFRKGLFDFLNEWMFFGSFVHIDNHKPHHSLYKFGFTYFRVKYIKNLIISSDGNHPIWIEGISGC